MNEISIKSNVISMSVDKLTDEQKQSLHGTLGAISLNIGEDSRKVSCTFSFYRGFLFACQNELNGAACPQLFGMSYSWRLSTETIFAVILSSETHLNVMSRRLLKAVTDPEYVKEHRMELFMLRVTKMEEDIEFLSNMRINGHHFDLRKGEISYYPNNIPLARTNSGSWSREGRLTYKAGKFIKMLLETEAAYLTLNGEMIENWLDRENAKLLTSFLEIKSGIVKSTAYQDCIQISDDPSSVYNTPTAENCGTLGSSCMRPESGHRCSEGYEWYSMIGTKIAYIKNPHNGNLHARALLWENCYFIKRVDDRRIMKIGTPFTLLDRIYGDEASIALMKEWAREQGYFYKSEQSSRSNTLISPMGEVVSKHFVWDKEIECLNEYSPYMDTFTYLFCEIRRLGSSGVSESYSIDLTDSGGHAFEDFETCPHCGSFVRSTFTVDTENGDNWGCDVCAIEIPDEETGNSTWVYRDGVVEYYDINGTRRVKRAEAVAHLNIVTAYIRGKGKVNVEVILPKPSFDSIETLVSELVMEEA